MAGCRLGFASIIAMAALSVIVGACGDEEPVADTLPPIETTTSTTTTIVTTTTIQQFYEVQSGDTLFKIAERFGVSLDDLIAINGIVNPDDIEAGQQLEIPPATVVVPLPDAETTTSAAPPDSGTTTIASP